MQKTKTSEAGFIGLIIVVVLLAVAAGIGALYIKRPLLLQNLLNRVGIHASLSPRTANSDTQMSDSMTTDSEASSMPMTSGNPSDSTMPMASGTQQSTMAELMAQGQSQECDWQLPATTATSPMGSGKLWTNGGTSRTTVTSAAGGMTIEANSIFKDGTMYTWINTNGTKMGFKFTQSQMTETNGSLTTQQRQQAAQMQTQMDFDCHPWTVDASKFVLPADVTFR